MRPLRGIGYKLISVVMFIFMNTLLKSVAEHIPPGEQVFFRSLFAIPVILVWLLMRGELRQGVGTKDPMGHLWRGVIGTTSMGLGFAALAFLPLPEATALGYASPLLLVLFAAILLKERVGAYRLSAVALGAIGVLVVLSPRLNFGGSADSGASTQNIGAILALSGAVCAALAQVQVRKLVAHEKTATIVFWFSISATVLSLLTLPFGWAVPSPTEMLCLIGAGLFGGAGQILLTSSYREANASIVAPFEYASILFAIVLGYMVFDEVPTPQILLGASIVILAGVLIIFRERQLGLKRDKQRKAMSPNL